MSSLTPVDAASREYPNVPLWCRISEAHPSFPIQHEERLTFEQLHIFVRDYVVGDKAIAPEAEAQFNTSCKRLGDMRRNMRREITYGKQYKQPGYSRRYKLDPLVAEYIKRYLCEKSCREIADMLGRNKDTIRKAAIHMGYRFIGRSGCCKGRWLAPGEIA